MATNIDIDDLNHEVQSINFRVDKIDKDVSGIGDNVEKILTLLRGNPLNTNDKGLTGLFSQLSASVSQLQKWRDRLAWTLIGMALPASIGVLDILKNVIAALK